MISVALQLSSEALLLIGGNQRFSDEYGNYQNRQVHASGLKVRQSVALAALISAESALILKRYVLIINPADLELYTLDFLSLYKFQAMKSIQLLLTRHGETEENRRHVLQGQLPGTLSDTGWQQAQWLADRLKDEPLDVIVCSDLARSYYTAETVAKSRGMIPVATSLLREMDWGIYTGETLEDVDWYHLPESVESVEDLFHRAGEFIDFLRVRYSGKKILAVGHGAFNRAILTYLQGGKPYDMVGMPIMENTELIRWEIG